MTSIFLIFIIFDNGILQLLSSVGFVNYWDEALTLILLFIDVVYLISSKFRMKKLDFCILISVIVTVVAGLLSDVYLHFQQSWASVGMDIVGYMKFFVCFVSVRLIGLDEIMARAIGKKTIGLIKASVVIMSLCGVLSLFINIGMSQDEVRNGIYPFQFIFTHPTFLVLSNVMIMALLNKYLRPEEVIKYELLIFLNIVLSMRTKGIVFVAGYFVLKYGQFFIRKFKVILWGLALGAFYYAGIGQLRTYQSFTNSPRQGLYTGAIRLLHMYFPFGSGFATFGSHLSGVYFSKVYDFIYIPSMIENSRVLGDAGYSYYIGQFGFIGLCSFFLAIWAMWKIVSKSSGRTSGFILILYILLALTSEATLINSGVQLGVLLAVLVGSNHPHEQEALLDRREGLTNML